MRLIINPIPASSNLKQIETRWLAYEDEAQTVVKLDEVTTEEHNLYKLQTNLIIPIGKTYYFKAVRLVEVLDSNGENIMVNGVDEDGNPTMVKLIKEVSSDKLTKLNSETDITNASNITITELPNVPILYRNDEENIQIHSTTLLPINLILDQVIWTIYDDKERVLHVERKTEDMYTIEIPEKFTIENDNLLVTCIHMSEGSASPVGKINIDVQSRIKILNLSRSVTPTKDLFLKFTTNGITSEDIHQVDLFDIDGLRLSATLSPDIESDTLLIPRDKLEHATNYRLDFRYNPRDNVEEVEVESFFFTTRDLTQIFSIDPTHKYSHNFDLFSSTSISKAKLRYTEKRPDGRTLIVVGEEGVTETLEWATSDRGKLIPIVTLTNTMEVPDGVVMSSINLFEDRILLVMVGNGETTFKVLQDSLNSLSINELSSLTLPYELNIDSMVFHGNYNSIFMCSKDHFVQIPMSKHLFLDPIDLHGTRPENTDKNILIPYDDDLIILGGENEYTYLYNPGTKTYSFFSVLPQNLLNINLAFTTLINGDTIVFPMDSNVRTVVTLNAIRKGFVPHVTTESIPLAKGIIKSNGVIILHDNATTAGYYV